MTQCFGLGKKQQTAGLALIDQDTEITCVLTQCFGLGKKQQTAGLALIDQGTVKFAGVESPASFFRYGETNINGMLESSTCLPSPTAAG